MAKVMQRGYDLRKSTIAKYIGFTLRQAWCPPGESMYHPLANWGLELRYYLPIRPGTEGKWQLIPERRHEKRFIITPRQAVKILKAVKGQ